jgi:hypothetical protein
MQQAGGAIPSFSQLVDPACPDVPLVVPEISPAIPDVPLELGLVVPDIPPATPLIPPAVVSFILDVHPIKPLIPPAVIPFVLVDVPPIVPFIPPVARGNPALVPAVPGATPFVPDIPELLPVVLDDPRIISAVLAPVTPLVPPAVLVPFTLDDEGIDRLIDGSSEIVDGADTVLHQLVGGGNNGADGTFLDGKDGTSVAASEHFVDGGTVTLDWLVNGAGIVFDGADGSLVNGVDG